MRRGRGAGPGSDVSVRAGAHSARGWSCSCRTRKRRRWRPPVCGNSSAHSFLQPQGWENLKAKGKKRREEKNVLFSPQERQEIGFKLMPG